MFISNNIFFRQSCNYTPIGTNTPKAIKDELSAVNPIKVFLAFCSFGFQFAQSYITKIVNQVSNVQKVIKQDWDITNKNFRI